MTDEHIPLAPPKVPKQKSSVKLASAAVESIDKFFEEVEIEIPQEDESDEEILEDEAPVKPSKIVKMRVNFPPFYHYRLTAGKQPFMVGKSHWIGDFETGTFSKTHGSITNTLALMIMKLIERYSLRGNWRNYSYRDEMQGQAILQLCQVVLQFDENKGSNPFGFLSKIAERSFVRILNIEKKNQTIRDDMLIQSGVAPSYSRTNGDSDYD